MKVLETSTSASFKNILFLTDLTAASTAASAYAVDFARRYQARLYPTYVQMPGAGTYIATYAVDYSQEILEGNRARVARVIEDTGLDGEPIAEEGIVEDVVPRLIQEHGIDLIVMGTHGRSGIGKFLLGSTAEAIFRTAYCPVLTVGPNVSVGSNGSPRIGNVVFATDLSPDSEYAVPYALSFARQNPCKITLLHVVPEEFRDHSDRSRQVNFMQGELQKLVPEENPAWCHPQYRVEQGDPAEQIAKVVEEEGADLLILGLPKRKEFSTHFRGGVTYSVVSRAHCPVLTIRSSRNWS